MISKKIFGVVAAAFILLPLVFGCAQNNSHWGQKLDVKKWWKKEGQSWDRKTKIFMTIGYSNPDWTDKYDMRKSADLDARSQVASFMKSLVKNYMEEIRSRNFSISEGIVEASANETLLGSVVVERRYVKKGRQKQYLSLIKVDLGYFFDHVYDQYEAQQAARIRKENRKLAQEELDSLIKEKTDSAIAKLKTVEEPAVEDAMKETGAGLGTRDSGLDKSRGDQ